MLLVVAAVVGAFIYMQFRGDLTDKTQLTLLSPRAGLVVEPGSKVTYNGVEIGRVSDITWSTSVARPWPNSRWT